jgi:hypothetical protein
MVMESVAVPAGFETESVTETVKLGVPVVVGVPLRTPAAERVNPAGSVEPVATDHTYPVSEPPVASSVFE